MASEVSFVEDTNGRLAHENLLRRIRDLLGGYAEIGAVTTPGVDKGSLEDLDSSPRAPTETWTIECTAVTPDITFSVTGSVTGADGTATVGTRYEGTVAFDIVEGTSAFVIGDTFTFDTTEGLGSTSDSVWEVLRYTTEAPNHILVLKGEGLSKTEEIFIGFYTYQNETSDYYNLSVFAATGYVPGNTIGTQPAVKIASVPCHNYRADYWITFNRQRVAVAIKAGTPVYESLYVGKILPYATPGQYPYPVVVGGMRNGGGVGIRYSDTSHSMPYKGNRDNFSLLLTSGNWINPECWPWNNPEVAGSEQIRDTNGEYPIDPIILSNSEGIYGELDGIYHISGFNNVVENIIQTPEADYVVIQDVGRTGFNDYYVMRMD